MFAVRTTLQVAALCAAAALPASAQSDSTRRPPAAAAQESRQPTVSAVVFGHYGFQPSTRTTQQPNQVDNAFLIERAYLTVRGSAGERTSLRVTADIYQSSEATPNAYTFRAKYAYLQYEGEPRTNGLAVTGRVGILHNVLLESQEDFWPRYLSQMGTEKAGFFSSADVGLASEVTLPGGAGEVYATIVNGSGYQSRERDRFKDYAIRLTLTPLARRSTLPPLLRSLTLTTWGYKGATASRFVNGGPGQLGAVGAAVDRSRAGVFVGVRDPRLTVAGEYARRHDGQEDGGNTVGAPRTTGAITGDLATALAIVRPLAFRSPRRTSPFGVVVRYDRVRPSVESRGVVPVPSPRDSYHNLIAGVLYDLSRRAQLALDYQETLPSSDPASTAPPGQMKGWFAHFTVGF